MARIHRSTRRTDRRGSAPARPKQEKTCPVCERPFHWRARWKRNWDAVVYCSRRCAGMRRTRNGADDGT